MHFRDCFSFKRAVARALASQGQTPTSFITCLEEMGKTRPFINKKASKTFVLSFGGALAEPQAAASSNRDETASEYYDDDGYSDYGSESQWG